MIEILSCKNKNNCEIKVYNKNKSKVEQIKMKWWACGPHTQTICQYFKKTPKVTPWPMNNVTVKLNTISVYFFFTYFINF